MPKIFFTLFSLLISSSVIAQDLSSFAKILVPVLNQSAEIVGPNGAKFTTNLGMLSYPREVTYYPGPGEQPVVSSRIGQITPLPVWEAPVVAKGRFVFVEPGAESLPIFAAVSALMPDGRRAITPLPVVRERDVRTGTAIFGLIANDVVYGPAGSSNPSFLGYRQRHTIRVYDFDTIGDVAVTIRMRFASWLDRRVIAEKTVLLSSRDFDHATYPYYFEGNLEQLFGDRWCFQGALRPGCQSFEAIIEVESVAPNTRYYAFISTTENDTNHVSVYEAR